MTEPFTDYEHLIRSLNKAQRALLDQLAIEQVEQGHPATIGKLWELGLIESEDKQSRERFGLFKWTAYYVPIHVHIAWAAVCAAEFDALSPEEQAAMEAPDAKENG